MHRIAVLKKKVLEESMPICIQNMKPRQIGYECMSYKCHSHFNVQAKDKKNKLKPQLNCCYKKKKSAATF